MVQTMIRLQNHGKKNHPYWWIIVQAKSKCFKGRVIERIGLWIPRKMKTIDRSLVINKDRAAYWLSVGAVPTEKVHYFLSLIDHLPRKPLPFGSKSVYEKPDKTFPLEYYHKHRWGLQTELAERNFYNEKISELEDIIERRQDYDNEALSSLINTTPNLQESLTDVDTDKIISDEEDFFGRKRNFDALTKKLAKNIENKYKLFRGNDLQYNTYIRKMEKLSKGGSLDFDGFKDFIKNIKNMNESKSNLVKKISAQFLKEFTEREQRLYEFNENSEMDINDNSKKSFKYTLQVEVDNYIKALTNRINDELKDNYSVFNDEELFNNEFETVRLLLQIRELKSTRFSVISMDIEDHSLNSRKMQNNMFGEIIKELDEKTIQYDDLIRNNEDLIEQIKNPTQKRFSDQFFDKLNKILTDNNKIKNNPRLFSKDINGDDIILDHQNIYLINADILNEEIERAYENLNKSSKPKDKPEDEKLTKFFKLQKEKFQNNQKNYDRFKDVYADKNKEIDIELLFDDLDVKEAKKVSDEFLANGITDDLEVDDILSPFEDVIAIAPQGGKKTKKNIQDEKLNNDLRKQDEEYKELFAKVLVQFKKAKKDGTLGQSKSEETIVDESETDKKEREIMDFLQKLDSGYHFDKQERSPFEIERDIRKRKFELNQRQYKLFKKQKAIKFKYENGKPGPDFEIDDETWKEKIWQAKEMKDIKAFEEAKRKKTEIPEHRRKVMEQKMVENFGVFKFVMYPDGFRQLEDFNTYKSVFPDKTLDEYLSELHCFCDFDMFQSLIKGQIEQMKKVALMGLEFPELSENYNFYPICLRTNDHDFKVILNEAYKKMLKQYNEHDKKMTVIEVLEQISHYNVSEAGIPFFNQANKIIGVSQEYKNFHEEFTYIPKKINQLPFPDLVNNIETNMPKASPFLPINPIKGHPIQFPIKLKKYDAPTMKKTFNMKGKRFSTVIKRDGTNFSAWAGITNMSSYL